MPRTPHCSWVRSPSEASQAGISRPPRRGRHASRPEVEALEPRQTPSVTFAADGGASFLAAADFNGDGRPDLVVA
jgi:hypothetical protein